MKYYYAYKARERKRAARKHFFQNIYPVIWTILSAIWILSFGIAMIVRISRSLTIGGELLMLIAPFLVDGMVSHFCREYME